MNKNDRVLNIVAIRKQIFKTFIWTIPSKLGLDYDRIKTLNSSMFETMSWNMKYLTIDNNEVINSFAIWRAIVYNFIMNIIYKLK